MKRACLKWMEELNEHPKAASFKIVNFVHDEWQTETPNNMEVALWVAEVQSRALRTVGEELKLNCPMGGSYYNDDRKDYTIGTNWLITH